MLCLFPTLSVPGIQDVEIFRDSKDRYQFYVLRGVPRIARDVAGNPMLSYLFLTRAAELAYESDAGKGQVEYQLGQLLLTTDLWLSDEEHTQIRKYLAEILAKESHPFVWMYRKLLKIPFFPRPTFDESAIKLGPVNTWKRGSSSIEILEGLGDTFQRSTSGEIKPSLIGNNAASHYATFGQEGSQVFIDAMEKGLKMLKKGDEDVAVPLQAIVRYDLTGYALVPSLEIKIYANSLDMYNFFQSEWNSHREKWISDINYRRRYGYWYGWRTYYGYDYEYTSGAVISDTDIRQITEKAMDSKVINITITDYGEVAANSEEIRQLENQVKSSMLNLVTNTIIPKFFEQAPLSERPSEDEESEIPPEEDPDKSNKKVAVQTYYFRNGLDASKVSFLNFNFKQNKAVEFNRYPNGTLVGQLTREELESAIKRIDISQIEAVPLEVQIRVNADFEADNIFAVLVHITYSQRDHKTGLVRENSRSYEYLTGEESNTFRVTMARNARGELIDSYNVVARISYKGTSEAPPPIKLNKISERSLVISYEKLGFVTVGIGAGDVDWEEVKEIIVNLTYLAEPNKPDTKKEIRLTQDNPEGDWKCYTYGNDTKEYEYSVRYIYRFNEEASVAPQRETKDTLIIDDNLMGRVKASFDVSIDNHIQDVKVEVVYEDMTFQIKEEYSQWFQESGTWDWVIRKREGATNKFSYRHIVTYKGEEGEGGLTITSPWIMAESKEDIPIIKYRRYRKSLIVDANLLDWDKWMMAFITVRFKDDEYGYFREKTIRLNKEHKVDLSFKVLAFDPKDNQFEYDLTLAGETDTIMLNGQVTDRGFILLSEQLLTPQET